MATVPCDRHLQTLPEVVDMFNMKSMVLADNFIGDRGLLPVLEVLPIGECDGCCCYTHHCGHIIVYMSLSPLSLSADHLPTPALHCDQHVETVQTQSP